MIQLKRAYEKPDSLDGYRVLVKNPPLGERLSATPAIADNTLYIRTAGHLYAFATQ